MTPFLETVVRRSPHIATTGQRILSRLTGRAWLSPRFDPIFKDGPSINWLQTNFVAFRRFHSVRPRNFTHVGMFAFSRGGSHLFESQLHMMKSCFCFGEGSLDFRSDLNWRTFACRGMYRTDSVQDKSKRDLTHLIYACNNAPLHLAKPQWMADGAPGFRRKWVLVLRNPLRILLSQQATGKTKWRLSAASAGLFLNGFERARARFRDLSQRFPDDTCVVSIEQFAEMPDAVLEQTAARLGINLVALASRPRPEQFFRRLGRTGEAPILQGGLLKSPTRSISVMGWAGKFNPVAPLDADRLYSHDLAASLSRDVLDVARERIGARLLDFYMNDRDHRFARVNANDLLE